MSTPQSRKLDRYDTCGVTERSLVFVPGSWHGVPQITGISRMVRTPSVLMRQLEDARQLQAGGWLPEKPSLDQKLGPFSPIPQPPDERR